MTLRSHRPLRVPLTVLTVVALAMAVGCAKKNTASQEATFTYVTPYDVVTEWDPAPSYSNEIIAMSNLYEGLTRYDSQTKQVKPLLATSWTTRDKGTTWEFKLRPGVTFHSGRPMNAAAAKAAILRTKKVATDGTAGYIWDSVKTIDTPDDQTLVFHLSYPAPLDLISSANYAAYIYDTEATGPDKAPESFSAKDAGTGPYTVEKWAKGQQIELTLKKFDKYWRGWSGRHFTKVAFRKVTEPSTAAQLLRGGEVSFIEEPGAQLYKSFQGDKKFRTSRTAGWQNQFAFFNTQRAPLNDPKVRQGIATAIDYDGIVAALQGTGTKATGIIPPGLFGYATDLAVPTYDQAKAKQLLNEAGFGPGKKPLKLELTYTEGDVFPETAAKIMKSNLAALNVELDVKALPWESQVWPKAKSADASKRQDMLLMSWWPDYASPYSWFINIFHSEDKPAFNLAYYSNPQLDKAIDSVEETTAVDRAKAAQIYHQMQETVLRDLPATLVGNQTYLRAMSSDFDGYVDNAGYPNVVFAYELNRR